MAAGVLQYALSLNTAGFTGPAQGAQGQMRGMGSAAKSMLGPLAAAAAAVTALAGAALGLNAFRTGIKGAFDLGGALSDLSVQTGVGVRDLAILEQAFKDNGIAAGQVGPSINRLQRALSGLNEQGQNTRTVFEGLGLDMDALRGMDATAQMEAVGKAISNLKNPADRSAAAMQLFGRAGGEMLALFADSGAIANATVTLGGQADLLQKNSAQFDRASDLLASAGTKMQGFFVGVADQVISGILPLLEAFNALDLSGLGQQVGAIIANLGDGFRTIFSIFRTESDLSFGEMLSETLRIANEMAVRFVGAVELFKSAIEQGRIGELLAKSLQLGAMVGTNALASGLITTIRAAGAFFHFVFKQYATLFTGGFNQAIVGMFSALPTLIGGLGVMIYAKFSSAFQDVAAVFSAGLVKSLDLLKEGISKIPGLNKVFGLEDFQATSFEQLLGEMRRSGGTSSAERIGREMLEEGMAKMADGFGQYRDITVDNFNDAFAGFRPSQVQVFDTDRARAELAGLAKEIDPDAFDKIRAPAEAIARASRDSLDAAQEIARMPALTPPALTPPPGMGADGMGFGGRDDEPSGRRRGLLSANDSIRARLARGQSIGAMDRLSLARASGEGGSLINPARAAERLARGNRAADPGQVRREERADAARRAAHPLYRLVEAIDAKFDNLVTA